MVKLVCSTRPCQSCAATSYTLWWRIALEKRARRGIAIGLEWLVA